MQKKNPSITVERGGEKLLFGVVSWPCVDGKVAIWGNGGRHGGSVLLDFFKISSFYPYHGDPIHRNYNFVLAVGSGWCGK